MVGGTEGNALVAEYLLGYCTSHYADNGFSSRGAATTTMVGYAVFGGVGIVGVTGTAKVSKRLIVFRVAVGVFDNKG